MDRILSLVVLGVALRRLKDTPHCPLPVSPAQSGVTSLFILQQPGLNLGGEEVGVFVKCWDTDLATVSWEINAESLGTRLRFGPNNTDERLIKEGSK